MRWPRLPGGSHLFGVGDPVDVYLVYRRDGTVRVLPCSPEGQRRARELTELGYYDRATVGDEEGAPTRFYLKRTGG